MVDRVVERDHFGINANSVDSFHSESCIAVQFNGVAVVNIPYPITGVVLDGKTVSRGERDLGALFHSAGSGRSGGRFHSLGRTAVGIKLVERKGLTGDVVCGIFIAAPICVVIYAQIARRIRAVLRGQITVIRQRPDHFGAADAHTVVVGSQVQIVCTCLDMVAALCGGDRPTVFLSAAGSSQLPVSNGCGDGQRLLLGAFASRRQHPCGVVLGHGDGDGIRCCNIRQRNLRPCCRLGSRWLCRKCGHRQQRKQHDQ